MDVLRAAEMRDLIDRQAIVFGDPSLWPDGALTTLCNQRCPAAREKYPPIGAASGVQQSRSSSAQSWPI
jgi:hypothetical protein